MKNNAIFTIFKKELARFFKDKRTLVALLMPGILIYIIYSLMGGFMGSIFIPDEDYVPAIAVVEMPDSLKANFENSGLFNVSNVGVAETDAQKDNIKDGTLDLLIVFPARFDDTVAAYGPASDSLPAQVKIYYDSSSTNSSLAYQTAVAILDNYESSLANKFDINRPDPATGQLNYDLATNENITGMIFSMMMPMLLIMLLFSGCMAVAPESIAGEKERGTIATLLITPTKRSLIAIGKILAL